MAAVEGESEIEMSRTEKKNYPDQKYLNCRTYWVSDKCKRLSSYLVISRVMTFQVNENALKLFCVLIEIYQITFLRFRDFSKTKVRTSYC